MPALPSFTDFMKITGPAIVTKPEDFVNEAVNSTYTLKALIEGRGKAKVLKGGSSLRDFLMFDDGSTAQFYTPGQSFSYTNPQVMEQTDAPWRFVIDFETWNDETIELNAGADMTSGARAQKYKDYKRIIEQRVLTSLLNKLENDWLWASPHGNTSSIESTTGDTPYPIAAFINEETYSLPYGWTTVQGLNPTSNDKWRCQQVQYDYNDINDASNDFGGLLDAFEDMKHSAQFDSVPMAGLDASETDNTRRIIVTNKQGMKSYKKVLRERNDLLLGNRQDGSYPKPEFDGIPVLYSSRLNTAALYPSSSAGTYVAWDAATVTNKGPRFYWIDMDWLFPYFHESNYFKKLDAFHPSAQPTSWIRPVRSYCQLFCRSRRRLGIVYPGA